jgi:hypothetical protein
MTMTETATTFGGGVVLLERREGVRAFMEKRQARFDDR